ncbi:MAG: DUF2812 domain-containing protein [Clostridia bacterium]|nr:DUF2812 domain-containing protein [Clostridia bacterium]
MSKDKGIKKEFLPFYSSDTDAVAERFEQRAAEGWMLKSLGLFAEYALCEPKKLRFNAVLCPVKGSNSASIPLGGSEYITLCEEAGWSFVCHRQEVYVFCTEDDSAPDIETDIAQRMESVKAANKRLWLGSIPGFVLLVLNIIRRIGMNASNAADRAFSHAVNYSSIFMIAALLVSLTANTIGVRKWLAVAGLAAKEGGRAPASLPGVLSRRKRIALIMLGALLFAVLGLLAYALLLCGPVVRSVVLALICSYALLALIFRKTIGKKHSKAKTVLLVILGMLFLAFTFLIFFIIFGLVFNVFEAAE